MTKSEYMERHGLTLRRVTKEDRAVARTDYQRDADYIISNGEWEWFSMNGSMRDMRLFVHYYAHEPNSLFMSHPARGELVNA